MARFSFSITFYLAVVFIQSVVLVADKVNCIPINEELNNYPVDASLEIAVIDNGQDERMIDLQEWTQREKRQYYYKPPSEELFREI